jgi:ABC-type lipoprotein export system ATPase subunit
MIELENVCKSYESPEGSEGAVVLKDISLKLDEGQAMAVVGPSGCGKSTLLNIIGALDQPTSGKVLFEGRDLAKLGEKQLAQIRNREIGFVFQLHHLLPQCTVLENVLIPTLAHEDKAGAEERAVGLLKRVGLGSHMQYRPGQLSGGQRQRVAVVRALINGPKLLLADEPTGSLDRSASENVAELLAEVHQSDGVALVVVTHSIQLARRIGPVMELDDGRLSSGDAR